MKRLLCLWIPLLLFCHTAQAADPLAEMRESVSKMTVEEVAVFREHMTKALNDRDWKQDDSRLQSLKMLNEMCDIRLSVIWAEKMDAEIETTGIEGVPRLPETNQGVTHVFRKGRWRICSGWMSETFAKQLSLPKHTRFCYAEMGHASGARLGMIAINKPDGPSFEFYLELPKPIADSVTELKYIQLTTEGVFHCRVAGETFSFDVQKLEEITRRVKGLDAHSR